MTRRVRTMGTCEAIAEDHDGPIEAYRVPLERWGDLTVQPTVKRVKLPGTRTPRIQSIPINPMLCLRHAEQLGGIRE